MTRGGGEMLVLVSNIPTWEEWTIEKKMKTIDAQDVFLHHSIPSNGSTGAMEIPWMIHLETPLPPWSLRCLGGIEGGGGGGFLMAGSVLKKRHFTLSILAYFFCRSTPDVCGKNFDEN